MTFDQSKLFGIINECKSVELKNVLLNYPYLINKDSTFGTPVHIASNLGRLEILQYLVGIGGDIYADGGISSANAVGYAAFSGHIEVLDYLLAIGGIMQTENAEKNPLFGAIYNGDFQTAKWLIDKGIDFKIAYKGEDGSTFNALDQANYLGKPEIAKYLLSKGATPANANKQDPFYKPAILNWAKIAIGAPSKLCGKLNIASKNGVEIYVAKHNSRNGPITIFTIGLSNIATIKLNNGKVSGLSEIFIQIPNYLTNSNKKNTNLEWATEWIANISNLLYQKEEYLRWPITIITNEDPALPIALNTRMDSFILIPMHKIPIKNKKFIWAHQILPIYPEEKLLEKNKGEEALLDALTKSKVSLIADLNRKVAT